MLRRMVFVYILTLLSVSSAYAQDNNESKGFYRIGIGTVDFQNLGYYNPEGDYKHLHYHEAALTANFSLGYGTDKLRAIVFFDPAIVDGVQGSSVLTTGVKGEVGVPWLKWLKIGGGFAYSHNHAKLSDDVKLYERTNLDTVFSPFLGVSFLPRSEGRGRFFADIRVGKAHGGDVIQPQTGKPVADVYISLSLGAQIKFK